MDNRIHAASMGDLDARLCKGREKEVMLTKMVTVTNKLQKCDYNRVSTNMLAYGFALNLQDYVFNHFRQVLGDEVAANRIVKRVMSEPEGAEHKHLQQQFLDYVEKYWPNQMPFIKKYEDGRKERLAKVKWTKREAEVDMEIRRILKQYAREHSNIVNIRAETQARARTREQIRVINTMREAKRAQEAEYIARTTPEERQHREEMYVERERAKEVLYRNPFYISTDKIPDDVIADRMRVRSIVDEYERVQKPLREKFRRECEERERKTREAVEKIKADKRAIFMKQRREFVLSLASRVTFERRQSRERAYDALCESLDKRNDMIVNLVRSALVSMQRARYLSAEGNRIIACTMKLLNLREETLAIDVMAVALSDFFLFVKGRNDVLVRVNGVPMRVYCSYNISFISYMMLLVYGTATPMEQFGVDLERFLCVSSIDAWLRHRHG